MNETARRSARRELAATLVVVLAGASLVLLAGTRQWAEVADPTLSVPPSTEAELTGQAVAPAARALGLVGLAGLVALAAARSAGRRIVGAVLGLAGLGIVLASLTWSPTEAFQDGARWGATAWPWVSVAGGLLVLAGGVSAVIRSGRWPTMGARYDAPAGRSRSEGDAWSALDRGEDPTG